MRRRVISQRPPITSLTSPQSVRVGLARKANPAYLYGSAQHSLVVARVKFKQFMNGHDGLKSLGEFIDSAGEGDLKTVCSMLDRRAVYHLVGQAAPNMAFPKVLARAVLHARGSQPLPPHSPPSSPPL